MADSFGFEAKPALIVAVDCGEVSSSFQAISSSGTSAFDKLNVFILCVDLTHRAILFLKGDGKELSFCGGDEFCDLLCVVFHSEKNLTDDRGHGNKKDEKKVSSKIFLFLTTFILHKLLVFKDLRRLDPVGVAAM